MDSGSATVLNEQYPMPERDTLTLVKGEGLQINSRCLFLDERFRFDNTATNDIVNSTDDPGNCSPLMCLLFISAFTPRSEDFYARRS
jgi:hypothetical protein